MLDVHFDVRSDAKGGDPDSKSPTLKKYHQILWSKPISSNIDFTIKSGGTGGYLYCQLGGEVINLGSDSISNSYINNSKLQNILRDVEEVQLQSFIDAGSTIGGYIVFPSKRIDKKLNINGARGFNPKIADRFDLTLECIRLYYENQDSPLRQVLQRYQSFFKIFETFQKYVDFFLLNDLVDSSYKKIKFFTSNSQPFEESPLPKDVDTYLEYRTNSMLFTESRNIRISEWATTRRLI
jgi:hypothetical protein